MKVHELMAKLIEAPPHATVAMNWLDGEGEEQSDDIAFVARWGSVIYICVGSVSRKGADEHY